MYELTQIIIAIVIIVFMAIILIAFKQAQEQRRERKRIKSGEFDEILDDENIYDPETGEIIDIDELGFTEEELQEEDDDDPFKAEQEVLGLLADYLFEQGQFYLSEWEVEEVDDFELLKIHMQYGQARIRELFVAMYSDKVYALFVETVIKDIKVFHLGMRIEFNKELGHYLFIDVEKKELFFSRLKGMRQIETDHLSCFVIDEAGDENYVLAIADLLSSYEEVEFEFHGKYLQLMWKHELEPKHIDQLVKLRKELNV